MNYKVNKLIQTYSYSNMNKERLSRKVATYYHLSEEERIHFKNYI